MEDSHYLIVLRRNDGAWMASDGTVIPSLPSSVATGVLELLASAELPHQLPEIRVAHLNSLRELSQSEIDTILKTGSADQLLKSLETV